MHTTPSHYRERARATMKLSLLQTAHNSRRASLLRTISADAVSSFQAAADSSRPSPSSSSSSLSLPPLFLLLLHCLCCLFSLLLGFCFSRVVFFLLFSSPAAAAVYTSSSAPVLRSTTTTTTTTLTTLTTTTSTTLTTLTETVTVPVVDRTPSPNHNSSSGVFAGRRGIRIRPWPHPNPAETMRAHRIVELVQREQLRQHGARGARRAIVVTPTHVRALQAPHLTGLMHSLMLVPYDLTWIVVEAGGVSKETASIFAKSNLDVLHIPFAAGKPMPTDRTGRRRMEARMRLHALRVVRDQRMDGIVLFADDSNIHSTDLFDEIQKVKWMGALSVGVLAHPVGSSAPPNRLQPAKEADGGGLPVPIQGPACDASGHFAGWHAFNSATNSVDFVAQRGKILQTKLEWSGFVLNSRLLWREAEGRPDWFRSLGDGEQIDSPLGLLKEASFVEPLGNCGKKVMLWWLRAEAHPDSNFPPGWIIEPSLEN